MTCGHLILLCNHSFHCIYWYVLVFRCIVLHSAPCVIQFHCAIVSPLLRSLISIQAYACYHPIFHSFILAISIAPLQALYHSEALPTTARTLYRSFTPKRTGNCRERTCPRSLRDGQSGSRTHDPPVESNRLNQCAITSCLCYMAGCC